LLDVLPVKVEKSQEEPEDDFHFQICMLLNELHKIEAVALDLWGIYRVGKTDLIVASLATNIAIDFVRQAEAEFEDTVVRPKKYPASKFPVWTLPAVVYSCQMEEFDDNPREEVLKPSPENMDHIAGNIDVKISRSTGRPLGTKDMCFMFVYWGIGIHLSCLMFERAMNPNPSGIAIPQVDVDAMRLALPWPDKVFHTLELLPQYQAAPNT
jgi:hypothetical protein